MRRRRPAKSEVPAAKATEEPESQSVNQSTMEQRPQPLSLRFLFTWNHMFFITGFQGTNKERTDGEGWTPGQEMGPLSSICSMRKDLRAAAWNEMDKSLIWIPDLGCKQTLV